LYNLFSHTILIVALLLNQWRDIIAMTHHIQLGKNNDLAPILQNSKYTSQRMVGVFFLTNIDSGNRINQLLNLKQVLVYKVVKY
jgi:hypothetical protein